MNLQWPAGTVQAHSDAEARAVLRRMQAEQRWVMCVALLGREYFLVPCGNRGSRVVELFIYFRRQVDPYRDWWEHADRSGFMLACDCCLYHHAVMHWLEHTLPELDMDGLVRLYTAYRAEEQQPRHE